MSDIDNPVSTVPVAETPTNTIFRLQDELHAMEASRTELQTRFDELQALHANQAENIRRYQEEVLAVRWKHERDIDRISELACEYADEKDYCQAFDEIVERINSNGGLSYPMTPREVERDFDVTVTVTVTATTTIRAKNEDEARDIAENQDMTLQDRLGDWSIDDWADMEIESVDEAS